MDKDTSIRKSVTFTIIELGIFIALCMIQAVIMPSQKDQPFIISLTINFLAGYLSLIAGIAATWYVVFTYYLMKSTIEFNRTMSDPFAIVSWEICEDEPELKAERLSSAGTEARDATNQQIQITSAAVRWVVLKIGNSRKKPIAKVSFRVGITGGSEVMAVKSFEVIFENHELQIEGEQRVKVGIVDLMRYQENVVLNMTIFDFSYQANDSTESQTDYWGDKQYSIQGLGIVVPRNLAGLT